MVHALTRVDRSGTDVDLSVFHAPGLGASGNFAAIRALVRVQDRNDPTIVSRCASDFMQMLYDTRVLLSSLAADDPARLADPALFNFFWAREVSADNFGAGGNLVRVYRPVALAGVGGTATHLVGREDLITVTWDGRMGTPPFAVSLATTTPPPRFR